MKWFLAAALLSLVACGTKEAPKAAEPVKKQESGPAPAVFKVRMETTEGPVVVEIHRDWVLRGVDHFHSLIAGKFYDGVKFHRVVREYVAQFGYNPSQAVDQIWRGFEIKDDPTKQKNRRGTLTFAARGPNTRTTQLFFNLADNSTLDKDGFAPIGKVITGLEVLDRLTFVYGDLPPQGLGPDPMKIQTLGYGYLLKEFPRLDTIKTARITE